MRGVFDQFRNCQGSPLPNGLFVAESGFAATENQSLAGELVSAGMLLAPQVDSSRGVRHFGFTPHAGIQPEEKTVLEKAMAILACVRYGEYFGSITRIKFPDVILDRISRSPYRIGPHSEIRQQYSLLALRGIGKVFPSKTERGRFYFELLPTEENLRAVQLARDLLLAGEAMETKVVDSGAQNLLFASGTYEESTRTIPKVQRQAPVSRKTKEAINTIVLGLSDEIRKA